MSHVVIESLESRTLFAVSVDPALVAWYTLDENAGTTVADASGQGNGGNLQGGPAWVAGQSGSALQFVSTSANRVVANDSATLDITGSITLSAWVKSTKKDSQVILRKARQDSIDGYELGLSSNGKAFFRLNQKTSGDTFRIDSAASYATNGVWQLITGSYDGTTLKIYINGVLQGNKAATTTIPLNNIALGVGSQDDGFHSMNGAIDDARVYRRALSEGEVLTLFKGDSPATNVSPTVNAGADQSITLPTNSVNLTATVADDGLPNPPAAVTTNWSVVATPAGGAVNFGNASLKATTASFNLAGTYTLRLTANDGSLSATDDVAVVLKPAGTVTTPPAAPAGLSGKTLSGSDIALTWTDAANNETGFEVQRSASFSFTSSTTLTLNTANLNGYTVTGLTKSTWYYVRVRAINSAGPSAYTSSVKIKTLNTTTTLANTAPKVNAGTDQTLPLSAGFATLAGTATDDGLPTPANLSIAWSLLSSPAGAGVTFGNASQLNTTVKFTAGGDYTLRLTAGDGALTASDDTVLHVTSAANPLDVALDNAIAFAQLQLKQTMTDLGNSTTKFVNRTSNSTGLWNVVGASDWTSGFLGGQMWQLYNATGATYWSGKATAWTTPLAGQATARTEDLYFRLMTTYLPLYQQTGNAAYRQVLLDAAASKNTQWNETVGAFETTWRKSTSGNPAANYGVLMDQTTDMLLMLWAAKETNNQTYYDRAVRHTRNVVNHLLRSDGGSYQFGYFDKNTGAFIDGETSQGYANESTWARGQAWAIFALTAVARETGLSDIQAGAQKAADWYIGHLPSDSVPYWDFDMPITASTYRDSSAAAIAASGLLDLCTLVTAPADQTKYRSAATAALTALSSSAYLAQGSISHGVLLHGAQNVPNVPVGNDVSLSFGDYFFLQAINRYKSLGL